MRASLVVLTFLVITPTGIYAQTSEDSRSTIGATVGFGQTWQDEGSIGKGWLAGGYLDFKLSRRFDLQIAVDGLGNTRRDALQADGRTTYVSVGLVARFGPPRASFFVGGGPGVAVYRGTTAFADGTFRRERRSVNGSWILGTGLSFRTSHDIEIAPLVRITLSNAEYDSDPWSSMAAGLRVGIGR